jgi:hypothetical protein
MHSPYWKLVFNGKRVFAWKRGISLSGAVLLCGGCVATAHGSANMEADAPVVFTSEPTLVEVDSGVWVVRDYDQPVYYVNDDYWVFRDGIWYRSHSYEGGWARVEVNVVPVLIVQRDHRMYVRYHGAATAQTRPAPGRDRHGPPEHAAEFKGGPPGQVEKEHREERREEHHEARAEDHDGHHDHGEHGKPEEKKEERKEDKKHKKH